MIFFTKNVVGLPNSYQCEIKSTSFVNNKGIINLSSNNPKINLYVGKKFSIDRITGKLFENELNVIGEPQVLDVGDKDSSFKVIWIKDGKGVIVQYLNVQEYSNSPQKPFSYLGGSLLIGGLCE